VWSLMRKNPRKFYFDNLEAILQSPGNDRPCDVLQYKLTNCVGFNHGAISSHCRCAFGV
jgi:hypothetical protein